METKIMAEQSNAQIHQSSWHSKFFDSFFASAAAVLVIVNYLITSFLPGIYLDAISSVPTLSYLFMHAFWLFGLLFAIGYSTYRYRKEKTEPLPIASRQAYCRAILRYSLSYILVGYGFAKVLGVQFGLTMNMQDVPLDQLNGFYLTWYYFYYSRPFVLIIAFFEITGSVLLLFRRTTLLGVFILLPVMTNITLTDYFYDIGPFNYALFITGGLIYLSSPHWEALKQLLLHTVDSLPKISNRTSTNLLRLAILVLAFLSMLQLVTPLRMERFDTVLQGKWKVEQQTVNGNPILPDAWEEDSTVSVWSNLYLENGYFTVCTHPYLFDPKKAKFGRYTYDASKKDLTVRFSGSEKEEVVNFSVDSLEANRMTVSGILKGDRATLSLTRVKPVKNYRVYLDW